MLPKAATVVSADAVDDFWCRFLAHRRDDRGQWLTRYLHRTLCSLISSDSPGAKSAFRVALHECAGLSEEVIHFARRYAPSRLCFDARLKVAGVTIRSAAPTHDEGPLSEEQMIAVLAVEDALATVLEQMVCDDLAAWLTAAGYAGEDAKAVESVGRLLLPQVGSPALGYCDPPDTQ